MVYTFTCTVSEKQERVTRISEVSVHQQIAGSAPVCVAQIHDEFWGDGRETTVTFSGGSFSVSRQYDTILEKHVVHAFLDDQRNICLYLNEDLVGPPAYTAFCLNCDGQTYPLDLFTDSKCKFQRIAVRQAPTAQAPEGAVFAVLERTKDFENGFEYVVSTDDASNIPLLMAIFTLPFATHNGF